MKITSLIRRLLSGVLLLILLTSPVIAAASETDMSVAQGCRTIDGQMPLNSGNERLVKAYAALLFDVTNDVLVYADNPDGQFAPAGLVKIMTAFIVAEQANMDDEVTVTQEVLDTIYSHNRGMDLQVGEVISIQSLMYAILVKNANIAAAVAADHVAGSQEAFVQLMNERAKELGCSGTNFVNVHGLSDSLQITTARDIAKIVLAAMKNEAFWEAFSTYVVRIPATNMSEERKLSSDNFLFNRNLGSNHFDGRATGSRMGMTGNGELNLVVTAERNDVQLVSIILGSTSEINPNGEEGCYKEARILLDIGFNDYKHVVVLHDNQVLEQFKVENGDCDVTGRVTVNAPTTLPVGTTDSDLTYRYIKENSAFKAPISKDAKLATVEVWYQNICIAQADLLALNDVSVQKVAVLDEIKVERDGGAFTILIIVAVIVGLLIILLFGRKFVFRMIRKHKIRHYRKHNRRSR